MASLDSQAAPPHPASAPLHERDGAGDSTPSSSAPSRSGRIPANPDRFDRMLFGLPPARPRSAPRPLVRVVPRPVVEAPSPTIVGAPRGARFVDHTACPYCGTEREGIEYHGQLRDGSKVHTIAAHTEGLRRVERGRPRCLGSGMRLTFTAAGWAGERAP
jgi:hypothetical protein